MSLKKIRSKLSLIKNYPAYPGLVLPDNLKVLRLLDKMSVGLNSKEYEYRKRLSEGLPGHENMQAINAENGYLIEDMSKNDVVMNAVKYAKEVADSINWEDKARSSKKAFLIALQALVQKVGISHVINIGKRGNVNSKSGHLGEE